MTDQVRTVRVTRWRWNAYMIPLFLASIAIGVYGVFVTAQPRFAAAPIAALPLWLILHFYTSKDGSDVPTIRAMPGAIPHLCILSGVVLMFAVLLMLDIYVIGHPFRAPLEPYHVVFFAPPFVLLFGGIFVVERHYKSPPEDNA